MSNVITSVNDQDVIAKVVQHYIDGAISGKGDDMKPAETDRSPRSFRSSNIAKAASF